MIASPGTDDMNYRSVEHTNEADQGSFTSYATCQAWRAATVTYKRLASLSPQSVNCPTTSWVWLRCQLSFSLKFAVMCLRCSRCRCNHVLCSSIHLAAHKGYIPLMGYTATFATKMAINLLSDSMKMNTPLLQSKYGRVNVGKLLVSNYALCTADEGQNVLQSVVT